MTIWRQSVALILGMVASPAWAAGVVPLEDPKQLPGLCRDVSLAEAAIPGAGDIVKRRLEEAAQKDARRAALEQVYAISVPGDAFAFQDYDNSTHRLLVDASKGFHLMRGTLAVWSVESDPFELPMPAGAAQDALKANERGTLQLHVYLHLDADPDVVDEQDNLKGQPCASRPGSGAFTLAVTYLGGELVDTKTKRTLGKFTTDKGRMTPLVAQMLLGDTQLSIKAPTGAGDAAGSVLKAVEGKRGALEKCYATHGGHAEGGMVVGMDVDASGAVKTVGIDVASLDNEPLAECLLGELKSTKLASKSLAHAHVAVPLVWERED